MHLLLLISLLAPPCQVYSTVAASDAWVASVRQMPLEQQLAAVRQRLACDAGVRGPAPESAVCVSCLTAEGQRAHQIAENQRKIAEIADTRPRGVVLFYLVDGRPLDPSANADWPKQLAKRNVRQISLLESQPAAALAGRRARYGLVQIITQAAQ
ncbi:MAG: hypothetical protein EOO56_14460 [Hymenobacter sp.]|nr:MAG: hypothetical protein EOO56_14460 [Hymenobacter sp.]